jgi:hypothetical protein
LTRRRRLHQWWAGRDTRVRFAWLLLACVLFGWPTTSTLQALGFPIFEQTMLALSWVAPAITATDLLFTSQLHEKQDAADSGAPPTDGR